MQCATFLMLPIGACSIYEMFFDPDAYKSKEETYALDPMIWIVAWAITFVSSVLTCRNRDFLNDHPAEMHYVNILFMQALLLLLSLVFYSQFHFVKPSLHHASNFGSCVVLYGVLMAYTSMPIWVIFIDMVLVPIPVAISPHVDTALVVTTYLQLMTTVIFALALNFQNRQSFLLDLRLQLKTHKHSLSKEHEVARESEIESMAHFRVIRSIAHDLRNSISAIMSGCRVLRTQCSQSTSALSLITMMETASSLCINFCDGLTIGVRLLRGDTVEPVVEKTNLRVMVEETMQLVKFGCGTASGVEVTAGVQRDVPECVHTDPLYVKRNLLHLMSNACKVTVSGTVHLDVSLQSSGQDRTDEALSLRFEVSDTGPGVTPEGRTSLFEPFVSFTDSMGLGLFLVSKQTEALGGQCGLADQPTGVPGSTFWCSIPLSPGSAAPPPARVWGRPHENLEVVIEDGHDLTFLYEEASEKGGPVVPASSGSVWSVLLIDDIASVLQLHARELEVNGYLVKTAHGSQEGLAMLKSEERFTVVLCDLIMPGLNGDHLTESFRLWEAEERQGEPSQPIYALTAYANAESRARCLKCGMQGVFEKPMRLDDINAVCQMIERQNLERKEWGRNSREREGGNQVVANLYRELQNFPRRRQAPKILLIDDVQSVLIIYAMWMRATGFDVTTANNGPAALDALYKSTYSLVLCDLLMPGVSGVDIITTYRIWEAQNRPKETPALIYALSAYERPHAEEYRGRCAKLGVQGILQKPLDVDHLCSICLHEPQFDNSRDGLITLPTDVLYSIVMYATVPTSLAPSGQTNTKAILANVSARMVWLVELVWNPEAGCQLSGYDPTSGPGPRTSDLAWVGVGLLDRVRPLPSLRDKPLPPDAITYRQEGGERGLPKRLAKRRPAIHGIEDSGGIPGDPKRNEESTGTGEDAGTGARVEARAEGTFYKPNGHTSPT